MDGLGTSQSLVKGDLPIDGVAMIVGKEIPGMTLLAVRLPAELVDLAPVIVRLAEK